MKYWIILIFLLVGGSAFSQSAEELEKQLAEAKDTKERITLSYELAEAYARTDAKKALEYGRKTYELATSAKNNSLAAQAAFLISELYERQRKEYETGNWLKTTVNLAKQASDGNLIVKAVQKQGRLAARDNNHRKAAQIYEDAFNYFSSSGTSMGDLERRYNMQKVQIEREKRELEAQRAQLEEDVKTLMSERDQLSSVNTRLSSQQEELVKDNQRKTQEVSAKEKELATVSQEKAKVSALAEEKEAQVKQLSRDALEQQAAVDAARAQVAEAQLANERNRNILYLTGGGAAFLLLLALLTYGRFRSSRRAKKTLEEKNKIIERERENSENLLLNILPQPIAQELKEHGKARARRFDQATVLLTDFKNFTRMSERLSPEELVDELDKCFKAFDFIIQQYPDIEKIKTIGDAYMCASGLSNQQTYPDNIIKAALEMQQFLDEQRLENTRLGKPFFEARIGIHTGPVVAGVVGVKKFAYDIWGDTVNIAARMEASCEEGQINISQTTYQWVASRFECKHRGKVEAKNMGAIDMYYVKRAYAPAMAV
jgi:class 3 adenylate cyclase